MFCSDRLCLPLTHLRALHHQFFLGSTGASNEEIEYVRPYLMYFYYDVIL
jgi:hypothetical protein